MPDDLAIYEIRLYKHHEDRAMEEYQHVEHMDHPKPPEEL